MLLKFFLLPHLKGIKFDKLKTYAHYKIPEYWIVEPNNGVLEQYTLQSNQYELFNIFQEDDEITSPVIPCISFTMSAIMNNVPKLE